MAATAFVYPAWLKGGLKPNEEEKAFALVTSSNWIKLSNNLQLLTERQLLVIIVLELGGRKRPEIIGKTRNRFLKLRAQRELDELWKIVPGAGVRGA